MRSLMATTQNVRFGVVFDMDGVLASNDHVMHHIKDTDSPDWDAFNDGLHACEPIEGWLALMHMLYEAGYYVVILTNRAERLRFMTEQWLKEHEVAHDLLVMRPEGTPYEESKRDRLVEIAKQCIITLAVDDDPSHVEMFREAGLPTLYAHSGYYTDGITAGVETADAAS